MAQVISPWQQFLQHLQDSSLLPPQLKLIDIPLSTRGSRVWILGSGAIAVLFLWDWKFIVSIGVGTTVLGVAYAMQQWNWGGFQNFARRLVAHPNRPFAVAVASAGLAAVGTYLAIALWTTADNPWIATAAIAEGFATLVILALLLGQNLGGFLHSETAFDLYEKLDRLTDADPLKRLIAVRQLLHAVKAGKFDEIESRTVSAAFRLMLQTETESIVLEAVLEGLQELDEPKKLASGTPALSLARSHQPQALPKRQPISPSLHKQREKQHVRVSSR
ncbi:MAG TPA: hypothetical protein IGS17_09340 [Oscillatoriales cyanobacterium M59_W2019_021]|nr:hypothetical protein [Oscillatoriales cyanobacterium M4454_W2019_049]HIK51112.1 hypothetical protein [Oscillatoriales cyanobacterium M59_W2019_021]